jgi:hypothetical protein
MRSTTLARTSTIAALFFLALLAVGVLGFGTMIVTNTAPRFSHTIRLAGDTSLEIHNGSACPRGMPTSACYWSSLAYRREFRLVYYVFGYRHALLSIRSPEH